MSMKNNQIEKISETINTQCTNELRGPVDSSDYKNIILPLVFYAEINRRYDNAKDEVAENYDIDLESADEDEIEILKDSAGSKLAYDINIPDGHSWVDLKNLSDHLASKIDDAFDTFETENDEYKGVFDRSFSNIGGLDSSDGNNVSSGDAKLKAVINIIDDEIYDRPDDFELPPDALGEMFMRLVKKFSEEDKGEYFTPPRLVRLLITLIEPFEPDSTFHDPCVGSAGMLTEIARQIDNRNSNNWYDENFDDINEANTRRDFLEYNGFKFTGQEVNNQIAGIAKMNMLLNGIPSNHEGSSIRRENSLTEPQFGPDSEGPNDFDYVVTNFPFSQNWDKYELEDDPRFDWHEKLPSKRYGDYAFIMHMYSMLNKGGTMASIIPHGVLFRNNEQRYREYIIENDLLEAVIGLPDNLFESVGIPSAIMILSNDKKHKDEVMFMNLDHKDRFFRDSGQNRNYLIDPWEDSEQMYTYMQPYEDMDNPVGNAEVKNLYEDWSDEERVCRVVSNNEIRENEYNMNIALYVDTTEPQEDIKVRDTLASIRSIEHEYQQLNQQFSEYMQQLNYEDNNQGDTE
jgi:type I restriction enzyme M protein